MSKLVKYNALVDRLNAELGSNCEVENHFNEIRFIIDDNEDKEAKLLEYTKLCDTLNKEKVDGFQIKVMYNDEYPDGVSDIRRSITTLSEKYPEISVTREMNTLVIRDLKVNLSENQLKKTSKIRNKIFFTLMPEMVFRKDDVKFEIRSGLVSYPFVINKSGSINVNNYKKLSVLQAEIIAYLSKLKKGVSYTLSSTEFQPCTLDQFKSSLQHLELVEYIRVLDYNFDNEAEFTNPGEGSSIKLKNAFSVELLEPTS